MCAARALIVEIIIVSTIYKLAGGCGLEGTTNSAAMALDFDRLSKQLEELRKCPPGLDELSEVPWLDVSVRADAGTEVGGVRCETLADQVLLGNLAAVARREAGPYLAVPFSKDAWVGQRWVGNVGLTCDAMRVARDRFANAGVVRVRQGFHDHDAFGNRVTRLQVETEYRATLAAIDVDVAAARAPVEVRVNREIDPLVRRRLRKLIDPRRAGGDQRERERIEGLVLRYWSCLEEHGVVVDVDALAQLPCSTSLPSLPLLGISGALGIADGRGTASGCSNSGDSWVRRPGGVDLRPACRLVAKFCRGRLDRGGRLYAPYQQLPKETRAKIRIDGEDVVELDYSAMHPRLLYAEAGRRCPVDPYAPPGWESWRQPLKAAFNVLVNAEDEDSGLGALVREVGRLVPEDERHLITEAVKALEKHNRAICGAFFSDAGVRLQAKDARIARRVLGRFVRRVRTELVLPVHDSFVVRATLGDELREVMLHEHKFVTGVDAVVS